MERPAILNRSMPSTAGATMSNPAFQRFADLSMRNTIYMLGRRYSLWRAGLPGDFGPVLTFEGNCSVLRAKPAHFVGHLPRRSPQSRPHLFTSVMPSLQHQRSMACFVQPGISTSRGLPTTPSITQRPAIYIFEAEIRHLRPPESGRCH
jgi:hypothetical protein